LHNGLPSNPEKLLALKNKATLNVSGQKLNALVIENFILRQPSSVKEVRHFIHSFFSWLWLWQRLYPFENAGILEMRGGCGRTAGEESLRAQQLRTQHSVRTLLWQQIISRGN
jgi:hypothetical protein